MQELDDLALLKHCGTSRGEEAFSILVKRHVDLVYSAAVRQVRDPELARDVSQGVFILLARKARELKPGTVVTGWLYRTTRFIALETLRSETRRRIREETAMKPLLEPSENSPWEEIAPHLDEAMGSLNEEDRDLVLLRYFENKSLREAGERLGISEDAAQKRVSRALEKLRTLFAARGVTLPAAALATLISGSAVQAAPAAVAVTIASAAAGLAATAPFTFQTIIQTITAMKMKTALISAALAATVTIPFIAQHRALQEVRQQNEKLKAALDQQTSEESQAFPGTSTGQITPSEMARLRAEAAEARQLRSELARQRRSDGPPLAWNQENDANAAWINPMERKELGKEAMKAGRYAEALEHYLWCFDEGEQSPGFGGVRLSFLLSDLKELGQVYPPAREAMRARRDAAEQLILTGQPDAMDIREYQRLNEHLGQADQTLRLFDQLPQGHSTREVLVEAALDEFVANRRYLDVVQAGNPESMFDQRRFSFEHYLEYSERKGVDANREHSLTTMRRSAVERGAKALEALAGAGQVDRALVLAEEIFNFAPSPETRGELLKHAERAAQPQVVAHIQNLRAEEIAGN